MISNITLEKLEIDKRCMVGMNVLRESLELQSYLDYEFNHMVYDLRAYVLAEEVDNRTKLVRFQTDVPANWWEHFKRDVLQRLFRGRLHIKFTYISRTKTVRFRKLATYPKANIALPELGDTIRYRTQLSIEEVDTNDIF